MLRALWGGMRGGRVARPRIATVACTAAGVLSFIWTETLQSDTRPFRTLDASRWVRLTLMIGWAHALGIAHHFARRTDVLEASALRLRQHEACRLLRLTYS